MKIKKESHAPPKKSKPLRYPELVTIKPCLVYVYPIGDKSKVQNACKWIRRAHGVNLVTRCDAKEITVRLKFVVPEEN